MCEKDWWEQRTQIDRIIMDDLYCVITQYLLQDEKYCEELDKCLTQKKINRVEFSMPMT